MCPPNPSPRSIFVNHAAARLPSVGYCSSSTELQGCGESEERRIARCRCRMHSPTSLLTELLVVELLLLLQSSSVVLSLLHRLAECSSSKQSDESALLPFVRRWISCRQVVGCHKIRKIAFHHVEIAHKSRRSLSSLPIFLYPSSNLNLSFNCSEFHEHRPRFKSNCGGTFIDFSTQRHRRPYHWAQHHFRAIH